MKRCKDCKHFVPHSYKILKARITATYRAVRLAERLILLTGISNINLQSCLANTAPRSGRQTIRGAAKMTGADHTPMDS